VAPVLKLGLFLLKSAAMTDDLPFPPIPDLERLEQLPVIEDVMNSFLDPADLERLEQLSVIEDAVNSFLDPMPKLFLDSYEATFTEGTIPHTGISLVRSLTGPAYDMIAEKVNKPKRSQWKELMTPVINHNGSLIWVKNEYQGFYE
jgi:hypothetical protein